MRKRILLICALLFALVLALGSCASVAVESIVHIEELTIAVGTSVSVEASVLPENASNPTLTFRSADEQFATVDEYGVVTGVARGHSIVVITASNDMMAFTMITVLQPVIDISLDRENLELNVNRNETLRVTLYPEYADMNTEVIFSSADESIATVDENGRVTAVAAGSTTITATVQDVDDNPLTAASEVRVIAPAPRQNAGSSSGGAITAPNRPPVMNLFPDEIVVFDNPFSSQE